MFEALSHKKNASQDLDPDADAKVPRPGCDGRDDVASNKKHKDKKKRSLSQDASDDDSVASDKKAKRDKKRGEIDADKSEKRKRDKKSKVESDEDDNEGHKKEKRKKKEKREKKHAESPVESDDEEREVEKKRKRKDKRDKKRVESPVESDDESEVEKKRRRKHAKDKREKKRTEGSVDSEAEVSDDKTGRAESKEASGKHAKDKREKKRTEISVDSEAEVAEVDGDKTDRVESKQASGKHANDKREKKRTEISVDSEAEVDDDGTGKDRDADVDALDNHTDDAKTANTLDQDAKDKCDKNHTAFDFTGNDEATDDGVQILQSKKPPAHDNIKDSTRETDVADDPTSPVKTAPVDAATQENAMPADKDSTSETDVTDDPTSPVKTAPVDAATQENAMLADKDAGPTTSPKIPRRKSRWDDAIPADNDAGSADLADILQRDLATATYGEGEERPGSPSLVFALCNPGSLPTSASGRLSPAGFGIAGGGFSLPSSPQVCLVCEIIVRRYCRPPLS